MKKRLSVLVLILVVLAAPTWAASKDLEGTRGRPKEALATYESVLHLYDIAADPIMRLRQKWLGAMIAAAFGRADTDAVAEREYRMATSEAMAMGLHYEAAKLLLEQAVFHAARRRYALLPAILEEALPLFAALGIGRNTSRSS